MNDALISVPKQAGRILQQVSNDGRAMRGGFPAGLDAFVGGVVAFSWWPGGFSWRTEPKQNILFSKKVSKV